MIFIEELVRYNQAKSKLKSIINRREELSALYKYPMPASFDKPYAGSNISESKAIRGLEVMEKLNEKQREVELELECIYNNLSKFLDILPDRERELLEVKLFIMPDASWRDISNRQAYSESNCRRLYYKGLEILKSFLL